MAGLEELIFGRDPSVDVRKEDTKTATQKTALEDLVKSLSAEVKTADTSGTLTAQEQQGQDLISQLISGSGDAFASLGQATQFDQAGIDDLFRTTIRDPLVQDVRENIIPEISARFGSQFFSSERQNQEGDAISQLVKTLAGEKSKLVQGERQRQLQALGLFPGFTSGAAGVAANSDLSTAKSDDQDRKRKELIQLLLGGTGQNTFENIATVDPGSSGALSSFLGGLGQGLGTPAPVKP